MRTEKPKYRFLKVILVFLNLITAVIYIVSVIAGWVPPSITSLFATFALIFPIVLLLNFAFIFIWTFWRNKWGFLSTFLLLVSYQTILDNFQFSGGSEKKAAIEISLLTYNLQRFGLDVDKETFTQNKESVVGFIKTENPDIICLQEFHGDGVTLYEPLQKMKTELKAVDYYYESYFNPRFNQLTGLVIFSKYDAVNKGKLKFEGSRTFGIYTDVLIGKDTVRVYNIHLASIQLMPSDIGFVVNPGQDEEDFNLHALKIYSKLSDAFELREHQMDYLVHEMARCPYPIILAGDFNDIPSSYVYTQISSKLEDTFVEKGQGFSVTYAGRLPFLRIDYVMKSENFKTKNYKRHKIDFSDHYPVSAVLTVQ